MHHPALDPPLLTPDLPGVGGRIRATPEDFEVDEVPFFQHNTVKQDKETGNQAAIALRNFELIYARITNVHATTDPVNRQLIPTGMEVAGYIIGFRADDQDGEPHTHILRV